MDELTKQIVDEAINSGMADQRVKAYEIQVKDWAEKMNRQLVMYHDIAVRSQAEIERMNSIQNLKLVLFSVFAFILGLLF